MNGDGFSAIEVVAEASVRTNGNRRACTRGTVFDTVNHVAVRSSGKARLESGTPDLIRVVDDHETCASSSESDKLRRRGDPVGDVRGLNGVPETDHSGNGDPTVLTIPAIGSAIAGTCAGVSVGSAGIHTAELIAGEDGGRTERMSQDPDVSERVHVVRGVDGESLTVAFGIMVGDEGVGGTTVAGRITLGLWTTKGSETAGLESRLEIESVLEGLDLTEPGVFTGGDTRSAAVVDL